MAGSGNRHVKMIREMYAPLLYQPCFSGDVICV